MDYVNGIKTDCEDASFETGDVVVVNGKQEQIKSTTSFTEDVTGNNVWQGVTELHYINVVTKKEDYENEELEPYCTPCVVYVLDL